MVFRNGKASEARNSKEKETSIRTKWPRFLFVVAVQLVMAPRCLVLIMFVLDWTKPDVGCISSKVAASPFLFFASSLTS